MAGRAGDADVGGGGTGGDDVGNGGAGGARYVGSGVGGGAAAAVVKGCRGGTRCSLGSTSMRDWAVDVW